jgi:hypothetical protein
MKQKISVMIATHKPYDFPEDTGYLPIHVGRALGKDLHIVGDNTGENISEKNRNFCELTGLYWLWKNGTANAYGLSHYRRYFTNYKKPGVDVKGIKVASTHELTDLLKDFDVILPRQRNYVVESVGTHYKNAHYAKDLAKLEKTVSELFPAYTASFDKVMSGRSLSLFNMFVMSKENFDRYCEWLFAVLFEVEKKIDYSNYGPYQGRVFGFMSERLLNVWICHNIKSEKILFLPVVNLEGENLFKKAVGLLKRKFLKVKHA